MPSSADLTIAEDLWNYLRLGQEVQPAECLLVFGGHDLGVARRAVELYRDGVAPLVLVSGGSANVPTGSRFTTEADAIVDIITSSGVPESSVLTERLASNTSENFWLSAELLRDRGLAFHRFLIVQKPYGERRTIATARRRWPSREVRVTSQVMTFAEYLSGDIPVKRILSMLAGEVLRLQRYADSGLIKIDEPVPSELLTGARQLQEAGFNARSMSAHHVGA
ncbi:MAG TPA: YdcF family protein [Actinophytocola sp.]|jgi:uncharacterized SAM-binding protein YcdF (DUF218 family)|uniref:YdcF family protein n=1 Tax=Actinophytocola sp. TaxID=1872138 RepID=UPI002DFCD24C|nr:YdcF family protein [Actinophytocola sp.]